MAPTEAIDRDTHPIWPRTVRTRAKCTPKTAISSSMVPPLFLTLPSVPLARLLPELATEIGTKSCSVESGMKPVEYDSRVLDSCPELSRVRSIYGEASALASPKQMENRRTWNWTASAAAVSQPIFAKLRSTRTELWLPMTTWRNSWFTEWTKLDSYSAPLGT